MHRILFCFLTIILFNSNINAQNDTTEYDPIMAVVFLDSFVVKASKKDFNIADFIDLVRKDESFYKAFRNLRFVNSTFYNDILFFNKKGKKTASYKSKAVQESDGRCRKMENMDERIEGNFFKRKRKHRYYTARMYHQLFFTSGRVCEDPNDRDWNESGRGMQKHINELKKLIFTPGRKADVPIIGNKTAIFDPKMMPYYDYLISSKTYHNGKECYVFTVKVKPEFENQKEGKTVIKFLETYFEKETFQVLGRSYRLESKTALFDFDVSMDVELIEKNSKYFPLNISYDGQWDIPAKKPEISKFSIKFSY